MGPISGRQARQKKKTLVAKEAKRVRQGVGTLGRPRNSGNPKNPPPSWVANSTGLGPLAGIASPSANKGVHALNGNISFGAFAGGTRNQISHALNGNTAAAWTPSVRMMEAISDVAPDRSRAVDVTRYHRVLFDSGADCSVCNGSFGLGRFVPISELSQDVIRPQSSQGHAMDVAGVRKVTLTLGTTTLDMEFWVLPNARRTILSVGELLRRGIQCQLIGIPNRTLFCPPRMVGAIHTERDASHVEWQNDHLWIYISETGTFFPGPLPPRPIPGTLVSQDAPWDVRVLLDSGSNVHTCPEEWVPESAVESARYATADETVLLDAAGRAIQCMSYRNVLLDVGGVERIQASFIVTPTVHEVILCCREAPAETRLHSSERGGSG